VNDSHEKALRVLDTLRLRRVGKAADMLWMHFGDYRTYTDDRGELREVGEWALHLQCPWRFVRSGSIVLASTDFYYYPDSDEPYDRDRGGETLFDRRANQFNRVLDSGEFCVSTVSCGACGAFELEFGSAFHFAVFPAASDGSPSGEFWRLFRPDRDERHYVVSSDSTEKT
jgi:hypothetical protein